MHKLILALKNFTVVCSNKCHSACKWKPKCSTYIVAVIMLMRIAILKISKSPLITFRLHSPVDNIQSLALHWTSVALFGFYIYVLV